MNAIETGTICAFALNAFRLGEVNTAGQLTHNENIETTVDDLFLETGIAGQRRENNKEVQDSAYQDEIYRS